MCGAPNTIRTPTPSTPGREDDPDRPSDTDGHKVIDLGGATLEVDASNGCSDADLLAFAAGVTVDLANI